MTNANLNILFVDDDPNILEAIKRQLRGKFNVDTALSADEGLKRVAAGTRYAAVVSDMRMPVMDGAAFLAQLRESSPDIVRLMLTGNADQESAARAVNEGRIFRFLSKPCSTPDLTKALQDALAQHRLVTAEKELLQKTLKGSIKLLTDVLSFTLPELFGGAVKIRRLMCESRSVLGQEASWEIELAGMLACIGFVTVPPPLLAKWRRGEALTAEEVELIEKTPEIGRGLIANIPRLEHVAECVYYQDKHFDGSGFPPDDVEREQIPTGARVLKIFRDLLALEEAGESRASAFQVLRERHGWYDPKLLSALQRHFCGNSGEPETTPVHSITAAQLVVGQTLCANIETKSGVLVLSAGAVITETLLERLENYRRFVGLKEPISVDCLIPLTVQADES